MPQLRFSLRSLLLLTVLASVLSCVVGWPYVEHRRQLSVARRLEAGGGWIDWRPRTTSWGADFFTRLGLGQAYLRVNGVEFKNGWQTCNDHLAGLSELPDLTWLSFHDTSVDDEGLGHFCDNRSLTHLELKDNIAITDKGLRRLKQTKLNTLDLDGTSVTYDGIRWITKRNPKLDRDNLIARHAVTQIKNSSLAHRNNIAIEWKLTPRDNIYVERNSRKQWHEAAEHLREFPWAVISQFRDLPFDAGPEHAWGLTISPVMLEDQTTITFRDLKPTLRRGTASAVALVPPPGQFVSTLIGDGPIQAWYGDPDWPAKIGTDRLEIPSSAQIVFVDTTSLPIEVALQSLR